MTARLSVSLLASACEDADQLVATAAEIVEAGLDLHVDVMDGSVTDGTGLDLELLPSLCRLGDVEVHLMVDEHERLLPLVLDAGPSRVTVHAEWSAGVVASATACRDAGVDFWVALGPSRPLAQAEEAAAQSAASGILLLGVTPGSRFERLQDGVVGRVSAMPKRWAVGVDGGVTMEQVSPMVSAGVDRLVVGRAFFALGDTTVASDRFAALLSD